MVRAFGSHPRGHGFEPLRLHQRQAPHPKIGVRQSKSDIYQRGNSMDKFILVLGGESPVLAGNLWTQYNVDVQDEKMVCTSVKEPSCSAEIYYSSFESAEFGIGSGNLWLQCVIDGNKLNFCSPRKSWKSEAGKKLIENIEKHTEIKDMKEYKSFTGPFFFFSLFK